MRSRMAMRSSSGPSNTMLCRSYFPLQVSWLFGTMLAPVLSVFLLAGAVVAEIAVAGVEPFLHAVAEFRECLARRRGGERKRLDFRAGADGGAKPHDFHRAMHAALVHLLHIGRNLRDPFRHDEYFVLQSVGREGAVGETHADRFDAVDGVACQHHLH